MDGTCKQPPQNYTTDQCFAYVPKSDVQPYFDIATSYGFANYFFQTNEGPSLPAHQFLLSGTSAPVPYQGSPQEWTWFDAENTGDTVSGHGKADAHTGCTATYQTEFTRLIDPNASEGPKTCSLTDPHCQFPCYDHPTLVDLLDGAHIGWKYYAPTAGGLWNAPIAIKKICMPSQMYNGVCQGSDWVKQRCQAISSRPRNDPVPIYSDISNCQLPAVSWVIPDKKWSDHATESDGTGPYYVANIVNGIGWSGCTDTVKGVQVPYWNDTAIFILWDDWGGWFDHVPPFKLGGQGNNWGKNYTYGFRVPLLVVSAYTPAGYVSGAISGAPVYPPPAKYTHDFGSILRFIEKNFGLGGSQISPSYPFADHWAPDDQPPNSALSDFFPIPSTTPRLFQGIPVDPLHGQSYFQNYFTVTDPSGTPDGPDAGDSD